MVLTPLESIGMRERGRIPSGSGRVECFPWVSLIRSISCKRSEIFLGAADPIVAFQVRFDDIGAESQAHDGYKL